MSHLARLGFVLTALLCAFATAAQEKAAYSIDHAKSKLETALRELPDTAPMLALLRDDRPAPDAQLPTTGVSLEWERLLSSAFVRAPDYGTRCSTIIRIERRGRAYFDEWTWNSVGTDAGRTSLQFELE